MIDLAIKSVKALDLTFGFIEVKIKFTSTGPYVIEVNPKSDAGTPLRLQISSDYNLFKEFAKLCLGSKPKVRANFNSYSGSTIIHSKFENKIVDSVYYKKNFKDEIYIKDILVKADKTVNNILGAHSIIAYSYFKAHNHKELIRKINNFQNSISVHYKEK